MTTAGATIRQSNGKYLAPRPPALAGPLLRLASGQLGAFSTVDQNPLVLTTCDMTGGRQGKAIGPPITLPVTICTRDQ